MTMQTQYDSGLVALSIAVAILASYAALSFAQNVRWASGRTRALWLGIGSVAMGIGIWSMHFVGMLAFEMPGMAMAYDLPLLILSVLVAIGASAIALAVVSRPLVPNRAFIIGGISMAAAIAGMHYIGMYSMRMPATIEWNYPLVGLSILIALFASFGALLIAIRYREKGAGFLLTGFASTLMGVAIAGMHYTGMVAATFRHLPGAGHDQAADSSDLLVTSGLTYAVITMSILILGLALFGSIAHRVIDRRARTDKDRLTKSEERFRLLVEAVKDYSIFMLDPAGYITTWNMGAERILGYKSEEILGKHFSIFLSKEDVDRGLHVQELKNALDTGHLELERPRLRKEGSVFWANIVLAPLYDDQKRLRGFYKVMRDITSMKVAEMRLRALNEDLERRVQERTAELVAAKEAAEVANSTKSAFLANMSHEIRTPLGAVLGFSDLLASEDLSASEKAKSAETIKRNGLLLSNIINDILDLSKVEAGKLEIEKLDVPFAEVMNELSSVLNLEAQAKGIELTVTAEGMIPSTICTDSMRLRQILMNIVGNAIKFTDRGSVAITVRLLPTGQGGHELAFEVRDTGEGIARDKAARLFEPFNQADVSTTRRFGGTGLGLALSKKLARALGGDVELTKSEPGRGSVFTITIDPGKPREILFRGEDRTKVSPLFRESESKSVDIKGLSVLVVDDSPDNQSLVKKLLKLAGATAEPARNGIEGVEKATTGLYDLVLMDLQMPEMDGYQATRELRARGFAKPIIALTAHAMKEEKKRCLESGFDDHVTKPIDKVTLLQRLAYYSAKRASVLDGPVPAIGSSISKQVRPDPPL